MTGAVTVVGIPIPSSNPAFLAVVGIHVFLGLICAVAGAGQCSAQNAPDITPGSAQSTRQVHKFPATDATETVIPAGDGRRGGFATVTEGESLRTGKLLV